MKRQFKEDATSKSRYKKHVIAAVLAVIIISIPVAYFLSIHPWQSPKPKAAIIDQLSSSRLSPNSRYENFTFVNATRDLLYNRFSAVDYYSDNATIEQYKQLSNAGYKLIVWRAHSALDFDSQFIAISTSEEYHLNEYADYLKNGDVTLCNITGDAKLYVAITPRFVRQIMNGRFEDTVLILMSCNGLKTYYYDTARAFEEKGVKAFISWDGWVDSSANDNAISLLLEHLVAENKTIKQAVNEIPQQNSTWELGGLTQLKYDPHVPQVEDYRVPDYREKQTVSSTMLILMMRTRKDKITLRCL